MFGVCVAFSPPPPPIPAALDDDLSQRMDGLFVVSFTFRGEKTRIMRRKRRRAKTLLALAHRSAVVAALFPTPGVLRGMGFHVVFCPYYIILLFFVSLIMLELQLVF